MNCSFFCWKNSVCFIDVFRSFVNWNIFSTFNINSFYFMRSWNIMISINCNNNFWLMKFIWSKSSMMNFWNNIKWNECFISNFESADMTIFLWLDWWRFINITWSWFYRNICSSSDYYLLNFFVILRNKIFIINFNYRSRFLNIFKSSSMSFRNDFDWNVCMLPNLKSTDWSFLSWLNWCFRSNKMLWCWFNWYICLTSNCNWLCFIRFNWNKVSSINCDYWKCWFLSWLKVCTMNFWNNTQRNVSFVSNSESVYWSFFSWIYSFWNICWIWCFVDRNISYTFNNYWFSCLVFNWNIMITINLNNWFRDRFFGWFE